MQALSLPSPLSTLTLILTLSCHMLSQSLQAAEQSQRIVDLMSEAIQYPTVSQQDTLTQDYGPFREFRGFLEQSFPQVFSQLQVTTIAEHSLLVRWPGTEADLAPVLFDSHYDVVPIEPGTEADWTQPPFAGAIADGYIWGRGALDDKASVMATLEAMERLLAAGYEPQRTLFFSFVHDEEIGGQQGARNVAAYLQQQVGELAFVIGEGGMVLADNPLVPNRPLANISIAEKTYATATLVARGPGGHSSMPVADNSIVRLSRAVQKIHDNPFKPQLVSPVTDMLQVVGQEVSGIAGWLMRNPGWSAPLLTRQMSQERTTNAMVRSTTAVTMFNAGIKENVISQQAQAKINFRLLPGYSVQALQTRLEALVNDPQVDITIKSWPAMPVANKAGEGYQAIASAIGKIKPEALVAPSLLTATTDRPKYKQLTQDLYGFHTFTMPLEDSSSIHNTNERVGVESIINAVELSEALIKEVGE